jgi:hypothetical protein
MIHENPTVLPYVASSYLTLLKVPHSKKLLQQHIEHNSYYPSIYSLHKVFNKYKVENMAIEVSETAIQTLPTPYIGYLKAQAAGRDFVLVKQIANNKVTINNGWGNDKIIDYKELQHNWLGVAFVAEANIQSKQYDYTTGKATDRKQVTRRLLLYILGIVLLGSIAYMATATLNFAQALALGSTGLMALAGLGITILLLGQEVNLKNKKV